MFKLYNILFFCSIACLIQGQYSAYKPLHYANSLAYQLAVLKQQEAQLKTKWQNNNATLQNFDQMLANERIESKRARLVAIIASNQNVDVSLKQRLAQVTNKIALFEQELNRINNNQLLVSTLAQEQQLINKLSLIR